MSNMYIYSLKFRKPTICRCLMTPTAVLHLTVHAFLISNRNRSAHQGTQPNSAAASCTLCTLESTDTSLN